MCAQKPTQVILVIPPTHPTHLMQFSQVQALQAQFLTALE